MPTVTTINNIETLATLTRKAKAIATQSEYVSRLAQALEACVEESTQCNDPADEIDFGTNTVYRLFEGEVRWWAEDDGHYVAFIDDIGEAESRLLRRMANAGFQVETLLDWQPDALSRGPAFARDLWCVRIRKNTQPQENCNAN